MKISSGQKQMQLLTLVPDSWKPDKIMEEFGVSEYKVRRAKDLKSKSGILTEPKPKVGMRLDKAVEERVKAFYEEDGHSRLLPGSKDYKSVKGTDW